MRITFIKTLTELAKKNKNIILLTGDLGFSILDNFQAEYPGQFINAGVAEQNMTGVAAGLSACGKNPWIYSIIPFITMRNFEQIRNDLCYQNLNVKIIGVGAGFSYGPYGHTHHSVEDIGILRTLPNMVILCPGDPIEVKCATRAAAKYHGPVYIRLGKTREPSVHTNEPDFQIGKGIIVQKGTDITIIATSTLLYRGLEVVRTLKEKHISAGLVSMHTIKPIDEGLILQCAKDSKAIFSLEEHSVIGGLGSAVAETLAEHNAHVLFKRLGIPDRFTKGIGDQEYLRAANGLSIDQIVKTVIGTIYEK
jgi:transketolase